jgi:hypothetical protein
MTARPRRAPRVAPAFDLGLFDSKSEFARILADGLAPAPAPPPALVVVPEPPAWAVEAALAAPTIERRRDFGASIERIQRGEHLVIRERSTDAYKYEHYWAYERANTFFYGVTLDGDPAWGRIDTRRSPRSFDAVREAGDAVNWQLSCAREALAVIRDLCPETRLVDDERPTSAGVYAGPNYILVGRPEDRYRAALDRLAAEAARTAALAGRPA